MARRTFIWLQLRKSSCDRVQCIQIKKKKFESISSNGSRDIAKSLKISFGYSFISFRAFGSIFWQFRFPVYTFQTKFALDYLYPFLSFSVLNFCAVCCSARGSALASHTDVRGFEPQYGSRLSSLTC